MKRTIITMLALAAFIMVWGQNETVASPKGTSVYSDNWESMAKSYQCPEWFKDAKFGIFIHWGAYSVAAYDCEWYPRNMYQKGHPAYEHHRKTWGSQDKFGYKDFIPMFKAEHFDAKKWAKLFKKAGAKYVVPVAEHHDGFAMYDSDINVWNAADMGPKKDIIALLKAEIEKEGLVFGVSSHRMENAWFFNGGMQFDSDVQDTTISLYGIRTGDHAYTEAWGKDWLEHTREIIDKYRPKLFWFDWTVNNPTVMPYFNKFMAYYYNNAIDWGEGVVVNTKQGYPTNVQVWDMERGKTDKMMIYPWQTDTSVGKKSWSYVEGEENKTPQQIVHDLVDIVSKNGNMLLNIGPRADGTITEEQTEILLAIGKWLKTNGEAIYGTRCWKRHGEGAAKGTKGTFSDNEATQYTTSDIRFTTKGNDLYAIVLNWGNETVIRSLDKKTVGNCKILGIELLGSSKKIQWELTDEGLRIAFPSKRPCEFAYSFKISFDSPVGSRLESEASNETLKHGG